MPEDHHENPDTDGRLRGLTATSTDGPVSVPLVVVAAVIGFAVLIPTLWIAVEASLLRASTILDVLLRPTTAQILFNTIVLVVGVTAGSILLGVPLAMLTAQTDLPFSRLFTVLAALPLVIPSYIGAFAFVSAFGPRGVLADALAPIGIERIPSIYGLFGSVLVITLYTYPYVFLTTRASLLSLDGRTIEAARTLNQGRWEAFKRVTLPQLRPGIAAGALLVALYAMADFGTPSIMRYDVFTRIIYVEYNAFRPEFSYVFSLILVGLTLLILYAEGRVERDEEGSAYVNRGTDRPGVISLGKWRWPAALACLAVAALALVVPPAILVMWLTRPAQDIGGAAIAFDWSYAYNSVTTSSSAALVGVVVALPLAYLSARGEGRLSSIPERASYIGYAIPGVVIGLGLLEFGLTIATPIYNTIAILVFAYVVRYLPQAVGTLRTSVLQVDPQLLEAARTLNVGSFRAFLKVVLPLVLPGVLAGGALIFLTSMRELPATILLKPFGFETLVTYIWQVQEAAVYGKAAMPALVLIGISALSMAVILGREHYNVRE